MREPAPVPMAALALPRRRTAAQRLLWRLPLGGFLSVCWCGFVYVIVLSPLAVIAAASLHGGSEYAILEFPPRNVTLKWYQEIPKSHYNAFLLSVSLGLTTALAACLLGVPAALGLVRGVVPGRALISALLRAPLQIPSIVIGIAFMQLYYAIGKATGLYGIGTFFGLAVGHIFHATPYVIGTTAAILQRFDVRIEEAALSLGASRWRAFRRVTLPVIAPGVYAGALYAFMISFGDVPISIFLVAPGFTTYPVEMFFSVELDLKPSILASATLVMLFSLGVMLLVQRVVGLEGLLKSGGGQ